MKKICAFAALLIVSCSAASFSEDVRGGTICQGSKAWRERNVCSTSTKSGLCIKTIDGPIFLKEIKSSAACTGILWIGIKDSWSIPEDTSEKPRWEMKSLPNVPLHVKDIEVKSGESLFVGTINGNDQVDSSRCYVTWTEK
jgi:hypothetical protein